MSEPTHIGDILKAMGAVQPDEGASNVRPFRNAPDVDVVYVASGGDLDINAWADHYVRLVMAMDREMQAALSQEAG